MRYEIGKFLSSMIREVWRVWIGGVEHAAFYLVLNFAGYASLDTKPELRILFAGDCTVILPTVRDAEGRLAFHPDWLQAIRWDL